MKKRAAAGAAAAKIITDQVSAASTGCCIGHALIVPDGLGFPHSTRLPATTALTGFQVVIASGRHPTARPVSGASERARYPQVRA